jgi:hypothetical protein
MKSIISSLFLAIFFLPTVDISMLGVKVGDTKTSVDKIKLKIIAQEDEMIKYRTDNGNDFSVTLEKGKVVYLENDWLQDEKGMKPLFSDFQFGLTSLGDIRKKFGTNGFTYKNRHAFTTETDLIEFNCFEFDSPNNEVLVVITKISLKEKPTEKNVAAKLKLDAIIITTKDHLDKTWGEEKLFDPNYKKIKQ